ncbi:MAG: hypothetical protein OXP68_06160 [Anaerolineaceae bacterium]|nr:hypothetical protein [Anaerolineaceae bacterium]MDE0327477.1 hypothetical protein [Anaerolineaceae bacterium]
MKKPQLRGRSGSHHEPWPIGEIPDSVLYGIGRQLVHIIAIGRADITGDDWGGIFAEAVDGTHLGSNVGIDDVVANGTAWSVKTVKKDNPWRSRRVRLVTGRNSIDFSYGISDPRRDPQVSGKGVLGIWNERMNSLLDKHNEIRVAVLVRNMISQEFVLFEYQAMQFPIGDYRWEFRKHGKSNNLRGYDKSSEEHCFTWQPSGAQFSIFRSVPGSARKFRIEKQIPLIPKTEVLDQIEFSNSWITFR